MPRELVGRALALGHAGIGIADRNTVAGVVRAYSALTEAKAAFRKERGAELPFKLAVGARLVFADGTPDILAYPENRAGWGRLCRLLTTGNRRAPKGECYHRPRRPSRARQRSPAHRHAGAAAGGAGGAARRASAKRHRARCGSRATMHRRGDDRRRLAGLQALGGSRPACRSSPSTTCSITTPASARCRTCVTCIREGVTIETAGKRLEANAERHLKPPEEMARLFRDAPEAIAETGHLLDRIDFSLDELRYEYPEEPVPPGWTPQGWLEELTWRRAPWRYPDGVPDKVVKLHQGRAGAHRPARLRALLPHHPRHRRAIAEDQGILCQGRGSAANSAVCYVLGITAVDPAETDLLFARFISTERQEPPDIDIDFEHERREEVIQHIYERYGRERAGIAATVITYRPRSAIREVGKALGLTEDVTARLAATYWGSWGSEIADGQISEAGLDPENPVIRRAIDLANQLLGFPRHLSQHVGGFVLSRGRLDETVPIGNAAMEDRTFVEWDKDDLDALGLMKVDVLGLGMLTCIRKAFELLAGHCGIDAQPRQRAEGGPGGLRHAAKGRFDRRVPGGKPGADEHAAAPQAEGLLRPRHRGGDRPAGADPGQHGASLSAPPRGARGGALSLALARARTGERTAAKCSARRSACRSSRSRR